MWECLGFRVCRIQDLRFGLSVASRNRVAEVGVSERQGANSGLGGL